MTRRLLALLPLAVSLAACETYPYMGDPYGPAPYPPSYPGEPYPPQAPEGGVYRAVGTEPFWDLTIGRDMVFTDRGTNQQVVQPTPVPINGFAGEIYRTPRIEVNIVHARCNDGMSDRVFPDTVDVRIDGRQYRGCGGVPGEDGNAMASSLDRSRWTVTTINGRSTPAGNFFIEFDNGRLAAELGCNALGANYTQNGATLDAGTVVATRKLCGDMTFETQGIAILEQVMTVQFTDDGRISLVSSAGRMDLVRR